MNAAAVATAPRLEVLSSHPGKRAVERYWLLYTPVWGIATAVVMLGGLANHWGDWELTLYSVVLGAGAVVPPVLWRKGDERALPWHRSTAFKMGLSVTLFALLMNYSNTAFFFDVLHMHYGFNTTWNLRQIPVGLYVLTVAYFATYATLCLIAFRVVRSALAGTPRWIRWPGMALAPFGVAALETASHVNPFMTHLFCYDDLTLALTLGTFSYGIGLALALACWLAIDERPGARIGTGAVVVGALAAVYAGTLANDALRWHVAPHFTVVEHGAQNFRDFDESCLEPLP